MRFSTKLGLNENLTATDNYHFKTKEEDSGLSYENMFPIAKNSEGIREELYSVSDTMRQNSVLEVYPPPYQRSTSRFSSSKGGGSSKGGSSSNTSDRTPPPTYYSPSSSERELYY